MHLCGSWSAAEHSLLLSCSLCALICCGAGGREGRGGESPDTATGSPQPFSPLHTRILPEKQDQEKVPLIALSPEARKILSLQKIWYLAIDTESY